MELNVDNLFAIIGAKEAELIMLRNELQKAREEIVKLQPKEDKAE